ncbi:pilus assembly protein TadG-related protein [Promicromonospora sp. NPDC057488]|uniref:pilus assembly protein TadG-related protein n=1 Tax=Promicromonospora sp. NPDC057488 TaxID=3346147 RepID=UPI00367074B4
MPRRTDDRERGSMHVMTIPVAVGMLTAAVLVIVMFGSATNDRREAGTAADAAALAAAQEWDDRLGLLPALHLLGGERSAFWELLEEALLGPGTEEEMYAAAQEYAERNGAELVDLDVDVERLRVTAKVRHQELVPGTEIGSAAHATAGIRLSGGVCLDGGLGWMIDGECVTEPPPDEDAGTGDDADPGDGGGSGTGDDDSGDDDSGDEEDEDWTPPEVTAYASDVVLVD